MDINLIHEDGSKDMEIETHNNPLNISVSREDSYFSDKENEEILGEDFGFIANKEKMRPQDELSDSDKEDFNSDEHQDMVVDQELIRKEKAFLLFQLKKLTAKGYNQTKIFDMNNSVDEIKDEVARIKKEIDLEKGLRWARQGLMFATGGLEVGSSFFTDGLEGWSESVQTNIDDYDEVLEELYEKYNTTIAMAPEIKLISMLTVSALQFHMTKKMFEGGISPKDILNKMNTQEPQEMKGPSENDMADILKKMKVNERTLSISSNGSTTKIVDLEEKPKKKKGKAKKPILEF